MKFDYIHRFLPVNEEVIPETTPFHVPHLYETMSRNRFIIHFPDALNIESWVVSSTARPSITMGLNGGHEWDKMVIKFRDPIGVSTSNRLWELFIGVTSQTETLTVHGDLLNEYRDRYSDIRVNGLTFNLEMLDPTGVVVSKWTINDSEIINFGFGDLSYDDSGVVECSMTVKPQNVQLHF
jgi:hypothetical protein